MPSPKRWFPMSRDVNDDPEFDELCTKFKVGGIRVWLEVLSILNKTTNEWVLLGDFCKSLARKCKTSRNTVVQVLHWCCNKGWITLVTDSQQRYAYMAPNYLKYNRTRELNRNKPASDVGASLAPLRYDTTQHERKDPLCPPQAGVACVSASPFLDGKIPANDPLPQKPSKVKREKRLTWRPNDFDVLWREYPRHDGKQAAVVAWEKLRPDDSMLVQIESTLAWQKNSEPWRKDRGMFVPHLSSWLNQRRWEDEPPGVSAQHGRQPGRHAEVVL